MSDTLPVVEASPIPADTQPPRAGRFRRATAWVTFAFVIPKELEGESDVRVQMARIQHRLSVCALLTGLLLGLSPVIVGGAALLRGMFTLKRDVSQMNDRVVRVERNVKAREFTINEPGPDSEVELTAPVSGHTPFPQLNHYLIVTPVRTGDDYVQAGRVNVSSGGSWTGNARFGEPSAGAGERFTVRCLGTAEVLEPGPLPPLPDDAVFSEPVTVIRKR